MINPSILWALSILGVLFAFVLLVSIRRDAGKIKQSEVLKNDFNKKSEQSRESVLQSLRVLAKSMIDGQVETSEGCYRIKVLLDFYDISLHEDARFSIFNTMYEGLQHMPTHEARKKVDKRFLLKLDVQRLELEDEHEKAVLNASRLLIEHLKDQ